MINCHPSIIMKKIIFIGIDIITGGSIIDIVKNPSKTYFKSNLRPL
jgi:hypothetical protein